MSRGSSSRSVINVMTVDVEDYFQVSAFEGIVAREHWGECPRRVAQNTERLLELFAERGVRATFFILGWVAEREPSLVNRIAAGGHEIASHGYWHRLVYDQTPAEFRDDVRRSKILLESLCGTRVAGYRAPSYSITRRSLWALDILAEEGFAYDASIFPIHHDRYGIPSAPRHPHLASGHRCVSEGAAAVQSTIFAPGLLEIPAATVRIACVNLPIGGGGYFRLLPYGWTRWGIARVNEAEGKPVVFYVHPWEIDAGQPRLTAPWLSRFRHHRNLGRTDSRLRRLLADFAFDSIAAVIIGGVETAPG